MAECEELVLVTLAKNKNDQVSQGELARVATYQVVRLPPCSLKAFRGACLSCNSWKKIKTKIIKLFYGKISKSLAQCRCLQPFLDTVFLINKWLNTYFHFNGVQENGVLARDQCHPFPPPPQNNKSVHMSSQPPLELVELDKIESNTKLSIFYLDEELVLVSEHLD